MRYSLRWIREFVSLPASNAELARRLPGLGFCVEGLEERGPGFSNVAVAEILKIEKHPNADRLCLCEVTDGREKLQVVCGARNIAVGQRVPLARVGALLPGGRKIERSKIRGVESQGMLCSERELGLGMDSSGIKILDSAAPLGADFAALAGGGDTLLELEITPNRPDVLSHFGLARELALAFEAPLRDPLRSTTLPTPSAAGPAFPVLIEDPLGCPRYLGRTIQDVQVGPSPGWMAERLSACGLRPINNVVDATNYLLLELGHPLHAFDQERLADGLAVRRAKPGELFKALDGREHVLDGSDLVIADHRRSVALAGIIGGQDSGISEKTKTVFLEAAYFKPAGIRQTAQRLRIRTDSSYRFERGTDPLALEGASRRAAALLLQICGPKTSASTPTDLYPQALRPPLIRLSRKTLEAKLGMEVAPERVELLLESLVRQDEKNAGKKNTPEGWAFVPPSFRVDLLGFEDVCEEAARLIGYDAVPSSPEPALPSAFDPAPLEAWTERLRDRLAALGFSEAYNYDFLSTADLQRGDPSSPSEQDLEKGLPRLENPVSADWVWLRPRLLHGLLRGLAHNANRGAQTILLFETGRVYSAAGESSALAGLLSGPLPESAHWQGPGRACDFFTLKGVVETLLPGQTLALKPGSVPWLHPKLSGLLSLGEEEKGSVGLLGQIHPQVAAAWKVPEAWYFELALDRLGAPPGWAKPMRPFTSFPTAKRDLSILIGEDVPWSKAARLLRPAGGTELMALDLVDVFQGKNIPPGKKSLTLRLTLGALDRTLSEPEIQSAIERALKALEKELGASLRQA